MSTIHLSGVGQEYEQTALEVPDVHDGLIPIPGRHGTYPRTTFCGLAVPSSAWPTTLAYDHPSACAECLAKRHAFRFDRVVPVRFPAVTS